MERSCKWWQWYVLPLPCPKSWREEIQSEAELVINSRQLSRGVEPPRFLLKRPKRGWLLITQDILAIWDYASGIPFIVIWDYASDNPFIASVQGDKSQTHCQIRKRLSTIPNCALLTSRGKNPFKTRHFTSLNICPKYFRTKGAGHSWLGSRFPAPK